MDQQIKSKWKSKALPFPSPNHTVPGPSSHAKLCVLQTDPAESEPWRTKRSRLAQHWLIYFTPQIISLPLCFLFHCLNFQPSPNKILLQLLYRSCFVTFWFSLQVPLLLSIGEEDTALVKATESGDTDLVYLVIFHIWQKVLFLLRYSYSQTIHMAHKQELNVIRKLIDSS